MAFENVNVAAAKGALNACLDSLDYSGIRTITAELKNPNNWRAPAQAKMTAALSNAEKQGFDVIKKQIESYKLIIGQIELYKKIQEETKQKKAELLVLQGQLMKPVTFKVEKQANTIMDKKQEKDPVVEAKIEKLKKEIKENESKMEILEKTINSSV